MHAGGILQSLLAICSRGAGGKAPGGMPRSHSLVAAGEGTFLPLHFWRHGSEQSRHPGQRRRHAGRASLGRGHDGAPFCARAFRAFAKLGISSATHPRYVGRRSELRAIPSCRGHRAGELYASEQRNGRAAECGTLRRGCARHGAKRTDSHRWRAGLFARSAFPEERGYVYAQRS